MAMTQLAERTRLGHPSLRRPAFYRFATWVMRQVFYMTSSVSLHGTERIPSSGGLVVVSNHVAWIDPVILGALFPRPLIFMAKQELWRIAPVGWVVDRYGAFPVRRGEADRGAIRRGLDILDAGGALGIFPEGTRSRTGALREPHPGASLLALRSEAAILPVAIRGSEDLRGSAWLRRVADIDITFGAPFRIERRSAGKERLAMATDEIMSRIAALLPAERRGRYGADDAG